MITKSFSSYFLSSSCLSQNSNDTNYYKATTLSRSRKVQKRISKPLLTDFLSSPRWQFLASMEWPCSPPSVAWPRAWPEPRCPTGSDRSAASSVGGRFVLYSSLFQIVLCKDKDNKIGLKVKAVNKGVFVCLVAKDSPAALGGLRSVGWWSSSFEWIQTAGLDYFRFGDQILQINSENVAGFSSDKVHDMLRKSSVNNITMIIRDRPFERTLTLHKVRKEETASRTIWPKTKFLSGLHRAHWIPVQGRQNNIPGSWLFCGQKWAFDWSQPTGGQRTERGWNPRQGHREHHRGRGRGDHCDRHPLTHLQPHHEEHVQLRDQEADGPLCPWRLVTALTILLLPVINPS